MATNDLAPEIQAGNTPGIAETAGKILDSPMARTVGRELVRGLFAVLGVRSAARRRR